MTDPQQAPLVSIIIPAHNCWELTRVCIDSIRQHTGIPYEIILIDDASDAGTAAHMAALAADDLIVIRNDTRKNFSANNNLGAARARAPYLCLLNNDTRVFAGWLDALYTVATREPQLGVLGNKHLFPKTGKLHHCGMAFDKKGYPLHLYPHSNPDEPRANYQRDLQLVTFACVLIPATVYAELGGLDEAYRNGFEDCDFCLRAAAAGYRIVYTPASVIEHHGQASPDRTVHDDANWKLFRERWADRIHIDWDERVEADRRYHKETAPRADRHADRGIHFAVDLSTGSAFTWATAELICSLLRKDVEVSLMPVARLHPSLEPDIRQQLRPLMRKQPHTACHIKWSHYWPACLKQPLAGDLNVEFFCTNYRQRPDTDTDLWLRSVQASQNRLLPISRFNAEALSDIGIPPERMAVTPLGYAPEIDRLFPDGVSVGTKPRLNLFVITNSHDLERYGTDLLIKACGSAYGPDDPVTLHIKDYGTSSGSRQLQDWIAAQPSFPQVVWHRDFLSRDDLIRLYAQMDVLVAPFRGEGFGMKVIDAMALGLPVLMPAFGGPTEFAPLDTFIPLAYHEVPVGPCYDRSHFHLSDGAYWCEVDLDNFIQQLRRLPDAREHVQAVGRRARAHVRPAYAWDQVATRFIEQIECWQAQRKAGQGALCRPSTCEWSVIIPTKDREPILEKTLRQYAAQDIQDVPWELLIVNDGGDVEALERTIAPYRERLNIRVLENTGHPGPASARNLAIKKAQCRLVLITGDDIIPAPDFLSAHHKMHKSHPGLETAVLGQTLWSKELETTPFMDYLTGEGGQQFAYQDLRHGKRAPYDRFYTSNISLKRAFLIEEEHLFHTGFRYAAYEDIELAYRLHLRGMEIRYNEKAIGYHHHQMDPESFLNRQIRVGRMLTYLTFVQPAYVPEEHAIFLQTLELLRINPELVKTLAPQENSVRAFRENWATLFRQQLDWLGGLQVEALTSPEAQHRIYLKWLTRHCGTQWEALNELALRIGMAEEWAADDAARTQAASAWITYLSLPGVLKKNHGELYRFLLDQGHTSDISNPWLYRAIYAYQASMRLPLIGPVLQSFQHSRLFAKIKQRLLRG
jgi:GT2 family glycosyltransferase